MTWVAANEAARAAARAASAATAASAAAAAAAAAAASAAGDGGALELAAASAADAATESRAAAASAAEARTRARVSRGGRQTFLIPTELPRPRLMDLRTWNVMWNGAHNVPLYRYDSYTSGESITTPASPLEQPLYTPPSLFRIRALIAAPEALGGWHASGSAAVLRERMGDGLDLLAKIQADRLQNGMPVGVFGDAASTNEGTPRVVYGTGTYDGRESQLIDADIPSADTSKDTVYIRDTTLRALKSRGIPLTDVASLACDNAAPQLAAYREVAVLAKVRDAWLQSIISCEIYFLARFVWASSTIAPPGPRAPLPPLSHRRPVERPS